MDMEQNNVQKKVITEEQLQNEFDFMMAQQLLKKMLDKDLISLDEFNKLSRENAEIFSPELASILP